MNIFEKASRGQYRFASSVGLIKTEQLWDLPLTSKSKPNLNDVAIAVSESLGKAQEDSFVPATAVSTGVRDLETKLEIVKHVIAVRVQEREDAKNASSKRAEKEKLIAALDRVENKELEGLSAADIRKKLADL